MDTPNFAGNRLDTSGHCEIPSVSALSFTPISPQMTATPKTPQYSRNMFGTGGVDITPTPHGADTTLLSLAGLSVRQMLETPTSNHSAANGLGQQCHPSNTPNHIGTYTYDRPLSQIWTPDPTPPERATHVGRETPVHMRWGSMHAQPSWTSQSLSQNPSFMPGHRHNLTADETMIRNYRDHLFPQFSLGPNSRLAQEGQGHVRENESVQSIETDAGAFVFKELHDLLQSHVEPNYHDNFQDLGIDLLRLSPKEYPIRQPIPAPPFSKVVHNNNNNNNNNNNHVQQGFLPMQAVMQQAARGGEAFVPETVSSMSKAAAASKFSFRYHGMHTESNASAEHITTEQNCALWLTNLPPDVTTRQLLASIRNVGRIWCSFINYPDYKAHQTAAAKVVFFSPEAAQNLLSMSWTKGLYIGNYRVKVSHNRIKYAGHPAMGKVSRILLITGRADFVNEETLTKFFKDRFIFQVDDVVELIKAEGRAVVEYKFGSYRCQSQMGKMSLEKDRPAGLEKVEFGDDPCEVGDNLASYGIAAERIQGRGL